MNMCSPCMQEKTNLGDKSCDTLCRKKCADVFVVPSQKWALYHLQSLTELHCLCPKPPALCQPCRKVHFVLRQLMRCIHPRMCCTYFFLWKGARLPACTMAKQLCEGGAPTACQRWWNELICGDCTGHWSLSRRALLEPFGAGSSLTLRCIKFECESTEAEGDKLR